MLRLFLTSMLVTMTNSKLYNKEIRQKCCNESPYIRLAKMAKSSIFDENLTSFFYKRKMMTFLVAKSFVA